MTVQQFADALLAQTEKVIVGKSRQIRLITAALLADGHVLLDDLPGSGKTTLVKTLSLALGCNFKRIQFVPDLLPADILGAKIFNQKTGEFEFRPGPLFSNIILADEINRATPRTQSSLLEAMEEKQITVDGVTSQLEPPFMVMATQNPLESYGTFPLPDAQMDRFFMRLSLGYMTRSQEMSVLGRKDSVSIIEDLQQVVSAEETAYVCYAYKEVMVTEAVLGYIMDIVEGTRTEDNFITGVSTRGAIALYKASQVTAAFAGRDYVIPEDVKLVAPHVLAHRISKDSGKTAAAIKFLAKIIENVPVPLETLS